MSMSSVSIHFTHKRPFRRSGPSSVGGGAEESKRKWAPERKLTDFIDLPDLKKHQSGHTQAHTPACT